MRGTMVNQTKETFQRHISKRARTHNEVFKIDREVRDHLRAEQLEVRADRRQGLEFNTYKIIMLSGFYKIKPQVRELRKHQRTRPLFRSINCRSGVRSSGRRERVDSKRFGSCFETHVKKITRPLKPSLWLLTLTCLKTRWLLASIKRAYTTGYQSLASTIQLITSRTINTKSWGTRLSLPKK